MIDQNVKKFLSGDQHFLFFQGIVNTRHKGPLLLVTLQKHKEKRTYHPNPKKMFVDLCYSGQ